MNIDKISGFVLKLFHQLFPPEKWCEEYIISIIESDIGTEIAILGLITYFLIKKACRNSSGNSTLNTCRVYLAAVLVGAVGRVSKALGVVLFPDSYIQSEFLAYSSIDKIFNPLSMLLLSVIMIEYYKDEKSKAFFFAISAMMISIIGTVVNGNEITVFKAFWVILIVFSIAATMLIKVKYIYVYYFIINIIQVLSKLVLEYIYKYEFNTEILKEKVFWMSEVPDMIMTYKTEYCIILFFVLMWFFFEKTVVKEYHSKAVKDNTSI